LLASHLDVSSELSLKSSLTIGEAKARGKVSSAQIEATITREKIIPIRVLVLALREAKPRRRGVDIASSWSERKILVVGSF
jgi:hypothetical protein